MTTTRTVNRLRIIASVLGAVLWVANDAKWFAAIADTVEDVPVQLGHANRFQAKVR